MRNSGATAVVEGIGDHGCEYMTGGVVVVLGTVGRNFAAGMSGGVAYVYDPKQQLAKQCAAEKLNLNAVPTQEAAQLQQLLRNHLSYTQSPLAKTILNNWPEAIKHFVQVVPEEYRLALLQIEQDNQLKEVG